MSYWESRKNLNYYKKIKQILNDLGPRKSILDVGSLDTPVATWGTFEERYSLDPRNRPPLPGVRAVTTSWPYRAMRPRTVSVVTCLQVIEHLEDTRDFCNHLFKTATDLTIISVSYKWRAGMCEYHVHDPIDESKLERLTGRTPDRITIVQDNKLERMIAEYGSLKVKDTMNCAHRSSNFSPEWCESCGVHIKTFECDIHGKCTLGKKLPGIACCNDRGRICRDFKIGDS